jgi:hypothetical protein
MKMCAAFNQELKAKNLKEEEKAFEGELKAGASAAAATDSKDSKTPVSELAARGTALLRAGGWGVLSVVLDAAGGASVNDHHIFQAHARKYEKEFLEDMQVCDCEELEQSK